MGEADTLLLSTSFLPLHVSRPLSLTGTPCLYLCSVHLTMAPCEFQRCPSFTSDFPIKYYIILVISYTANMSFQGGDHSESVVSSCVAYSNLEKKKVVLINEVIYTKKFKFFFPIFRQMLLSTLRPPWSLSKLMQKTSFCVYLFFVMFISHLCFLCAFLQWAKHR